MIKFLLRACRTKLSRRYLPCYVVSRSPMIAVSYWQDFYNEREAFVKSLSAVPRVSLLFQLGWHRETDERVMEIVTALEPLRKIVPEWRFVFLCNSPGEEKLFRAYGLDALFCHQNAFLDERRYRVIPCAAKKFDAIYIARITPFKRHELAAAIESLLLIGDYSLPERDYCRRVMTTLAHAVWKRRCRAWNIYRAINKARVGLCLSAEEGAMFVSAEYLLCGIPAVSTPNRGGRDTLLPPEFVSAAADNPADVARSVKKLIDSNFDPMAVRRAVIARMLPFRETFIGLVQSIYDREQAGRDFRREWPRVFIHKLGLRRRVAPSIRWRRGLVRP